MLTILDAAQVPLSEILARTEDQRDISGLTADIIADVRQSGDAALRRYTKEFDKAEPDTLEVPLRPGGSGGEHPRLPPAAGAEWVHHQRQARHRLRAEGDTH